MKQRLGVALANATLFLVIFAANVLAHGEDGNPTTVTRSDWLTQIPLVLVMIGVVLLVHYLFIAQIRKAEKQTA